MRLLNAHTLEFEEFCDDENTRPKYAILSHTWGEEEVTHKDMRKHRDQAAKKNGFKKITLCAKQTLKDNLEYFWIDTCCIDKSSSAELSEAINSMFRWYWSGLETPI
ncbi:heterokaryon incompatibility protein-domain-containing protein [Cercophora newfieldiana]|uniref:Heterokaryon incompatibility protein-domain-containing protein n=1 Tax=Cercophora newfieldiana TaxID=92897 RepID=A0AA40CNL4_9PEZI|nr:heterokaryon incompatibility protein-domain-containing protein [Cercophora newfieldiana]